MGSTFRFAIDTARGEGWGAFEGKWRLSSGFLSAHYLVRWHSARNVRFLFFYRNATVCSFRNTQYKEEGRSPSVLETHWNDKTLRCGQVVRSNILASTPPRPSLEGVPLLLESLCPTAYRPGLPLGSFARSFGASCR